MLQKQLHLTVPLKYKCSEHNLICKKNYHNPGTLSKVPNKPKQSSGGCHAWCNEEFPKAMSTLLPISCPLCAFVFRHVKLPSLVKQTKEHLDTIGGLFATVSSKTGILRLTMRIGCCCGALKSMTQRLLYVCFFLCSSHWFESGVRGGKKEVAVLNHNLMTCVCWYCQKINWLCGCESWWGRLAAVWALLYINFDYCLFSPIFSMMPRKM